MRGVKGAGTVTTESREVNQRLSRIKVNIPCHLSIENVTTKNKDPFLTISADDNILQLIKTDISNGTLNINNAEDFVIRNQIKIVLGIQCLHELEACRQSRVRFEEFYEKTPVVLKGYDQSQIEGKINTGQLTIDLGAQVKMTLEGSVVQQKVKTGSQAKYYASNLKSEHVTIHLGSQGYAEIHVAQNQVVPIQRSPITMKCERQSHIKGIIYASELDVHLDSQAKITLEGNVGQQKVQVGSQAHYYGSKLYSDYATIHLGSQSKVWVQVWKSLSGSRGSQAKIENTGSAKFVEN